MSGDMDFERLRQAADEAGWLVARGYPPTAVSIFVAEHRALGVEEQRLLACATRFRAEYAKHIARELEPEDIAKRPLRIDVSSVLGVLDAARAGRTLLESPAGVIADPDWQRPGGKLGDWAAVFDQLERALRSLKPSLVRWYVDETAPWGDELAVSVGKRSKPKSELVRVPDAAMALAGAAYVASSDPAVLDGAACWVNLVRRALGDMRAKVVRLED